jgi:ACS family hexuronate transporter-like MFS transporter
VQSAWQLGVYRFLLGAGEGGCFPGVTKGVTEWFPKRERALAIGIAIGGASLGGFVAPPLTAWLVGLGGWRLAFLVSGLAGALWVAAWWVFYDTPGRSRWVTDEEQVLIAAGQDEGPGAAKAPAEPLRELLSRRDVWGLAAMRFLFDPVFYLYMFWIPEYLNRERGLDIKAIGGLANLPFLALGISNIVGGWASDRLIARGVPALRARKLVMTGAAILTMASSLVATSRTAGMAVALMSVLMFAHGFWITNYVTVISETFDRRSVATVMGLAGLVGTLGGAMANTIIGWVSERYSYLPIWIASGLLYPAALVVLLLTVGRARAKPARPDGGLEEF